MSAIYDNWERLVAAVIKKQQLWELFHEQSRSPSILSDASDFTSSHHLVLFSDFLPPFHASTQLLGESACVAEMGGGKRFVVKRVKAVGISEAEFKRNMEVVGGVRHENVVALGAYYSSASHKLVLYDYYANGSASSLLYGKNRASIKWVTRVRIAIGAARGLAHIHARKLVHGNIKSSNILLNQRLYGCISDFNHTPSPNNPQNPSQPSDVYCFGVLLLELLAKKPAAEGPSPAHLIKLVNSIKNKERATKVFDPNLLKHSSISQEMIKMLQIGIRCVFRTPRKRPKMFEVVKMLEGSMIPRWIPTEGELVFVEDGGPIFDVGHVMRGPCEVMGSGSSGTCLKTRLDDGNIVVVKMLRNVGVGFEEFQQHVEDFRRMNHINVGGLKAYYYSSDDKFLVYDYYHQGSLSTLLHGDDEMCLDWGTKLEIAMGAARGIAYIHRQQGGNLVLGNIKATNIFFNGQNHSGIAFDAGLAKLISPTTLLSSGYSAPELNSLGELSQACDVYSFGVVLLELILGKTSQQLMTNGEWSRQVLDVDDEEIMQVLQIAISCVCTEPQNRPTMFEVVKELEGISGGVELGLCVDSRLECFLEDLIVGKFI